MLGATEIVLDTNASLEAAGALYRRAGYVDVAAVQRQPERHELVPQARLVASARLERRV